MAKYYIKKRKTFRRKKATARVTKSKVKRVMMSMTERKYFNGSGSSVIANAWNNGGSLIAGITQGNSATNRIGNKIFIHAIHISYLITVTTPGSFPSGGAIARFALIHNKETVGVAAVGNQGVWTTDTVDAWRHPPLKNRYGVVIDRTAQLVVTSSDSTGVVKSAGPAYVYQHTIYPKKMVDYNGTGSGVIADLYKDDWECMHICNEPNSSMTMSMRWQVIFSDS